MGLKNIVNKVIKEVKVVQGEETKDKLFSNENTFPDEATAAKEFERARQKLLDINNWSNIAGITSTFELYDERGRKTTAIQPKTGYYIKIILPGAPIENWVQISEIHTEKDMAEVIVHPSSKPQEFTNEEEVVEHFFTKEASSTFRVVRQGNKLMAFEIGKNEGINNQGEEAGNRAILNTLISEGGWAGFQDMQWDNLTKYLVHLTELT